MQRSTDSGDVLIISIVFSALLLATALAYFGWGADERWDGAYEQATVQAYLLAEQGIIERGLQYLRTRSPGDLPQGTTFLQSRKIKGVGEYKRISVRRVMSESEGDVFQRVNYYDIFATGKAPFGIDQKVERTKRLRVKLRSFANYMYLTDLETTVFDEIIWFWGRDTLYGRTHSNDFIGIKGRPVFYGPISTSQDRFLRGAGYRPYFEYPPQFGVPQVYFPITAETIRNNANPWIEGESRGRMTRVWFRGNAGILIYQYRIGGFSPPLYDPGDVEIVADIAPPAWGGIFVNGQCEIYGQVAGKLTVGSSRNMWIVDNISYVGADPYNGYFGAGYIEQRQMPHQLGLISEANIIIKNTWYNGREDGFNQFPADHARHSVVITAAMVALGESFTFQYMNDEGDLYQGPSPDERGIIHLTGAITQKRRGYVHRSNHEGTGYGKDYHYDFRLDHIPPPFYLEALDKEGHGLFDLVRWERLRPSR